MARRPPRPKRAAQRPRYVHEIRQEHIGGLKPDRVTEVPAWGAFLSLPAFRAMLVAIEAELMKRRVAARYQGDNFSVAFSDGRLGHVRIAPVAERCRSAALEDIPACVAAIIEGALGPVPTTPEDDTMPPFEQVAPSLIAHLYRDTMIERLRAQLVVRPVCEGLSVGVAVDFGHVISALPRDAMQVWGRSDDELLRVGMQNVHRKSVTRESFTIEGLPALLLSGSDYTVSSQALFLGDHLGAHYPAGALVSIPTRNSVFCVALQTGSLLGSAERIARTVSLVHDWFDDFASRPRNAEQMFSEHMYWWRDGALHAFPAVMTGAGAVVAPPQEFIDAVLARQDGPRDDRS